MSGAPRRRDRRSRACGALTGAGVALYYLGWRAGQRDDGSDGGDPHAVRWAPVVGASTAGVALSGAF